MKIGIIIISVLILSTLALKAFKTKNYQNRTPQFVEKDGDNFKTHLLPKVPKNWVQETIDKFEGKEYDKYDNYHYRFSDKLCNDVYRSYKYWEKGESHYDFLSKLNDTQKMYFALINFEGQTNNGGVYQFLYNQPENSIITLEALKDAKLIRLSKDYEIVLNQFFGKFSTISELRSKFQNGKINWEKRWNSFVEGYKEIPHAEKIEEYFYEEEYSKEYHSKIAQFVINNQNNLMIKE